jgi:20S proteasome alpha/beta subunit
VTVCIAAACKIQSHTSIVLCCDWQGTKGDFIKSDSVDKFRYIRSASAMIAGSLTEADELVNECEAAIKAYVAKVGSADSDLHMQEYLKALRDAVWVRKQALTREHIRLNYALELEEFWKNGKQYLSQSQHDEALREIRNIDIAASVIISSLAADETDAIVKITLSGKVQWENEFSTIGSGGPIAEAFLHQYDWDEDVPLEECLYRVYGAKVAAEKNPHVGPATSMEILTPDGRFDLTEAGWKYLEKTVRPSRVPKLNFPTPYLQEIKDDDDGATIES